MSQYNPIQVHLIWDDLSLMGLDVHSFPSLEKSSDIVALNMLSVPFSFSSSSEISKLQILCIFMCHIIPMRFLYSFSFFFLFVPLTGKIQLSYPPNLWFFLLHGHIYFWNSLFSFSVHFFVFFNSKISVWLFFDDFCFLVQFLFLFMHYFLNYVSLCFLVIY